MSIPSSALQGLGAVAASPLGRAVVRYWWVTAPLGYLAYHYWNERKAKGNATIGGMVHDLAPAVGVVVGLITLNQILAASEAAKPVLNTAAATDASFTVQPRA